MEIFFGIRLKPSEKIMHIINTKMAIVQNNPGTYFKSLQNINIGNLSLAFSHRDNTNGFYFKFVTIICNHLSWITTNRHQINNWFIYITLIIDFCNQSRLRINKSLANLRLNKKFRSNLCSIFSKSSNQTKFHELSDLFFIINLFLEVNWNFSSFWLSSTHPILPFFIISLHSIW